MGNSAPYTDIISRFKFGVWGNNGIIRSTKMWIRFIAIKFNDLINKIEEN